MSEKKAYPLRINADVLAAAQRWADDELRSLNAQIEYLLRDAWRKAADFLLRRGFGMEQARAAWIAAKGEGAD